MEAIDQLQQKYDERTNEIEKYQQSVENIKQEARLATIEARAAHERATTHIQQLQNHIMENEAMISRIDKHNKILAKQLLMLSQRLFPLEDLLQIVLCMPFSIII